MAFWSRLLGSRQDERAEARRRGINVEKVEREVPIYQHLSTKFSHLEPISFIRYSIKKE